MKIKLSHTLTTLLVLLCTTCLYGQSDQGGGFHFTCASWERISGSPIHYLAGRPTKNEDIQSKLERLKEVDVTEMTRSQSYEFKGGRVVNFYRTKPSSDGEVALQKVAAVNVPASWNNALFVFFPGKNKDTYRIYPINDDRSHAPFGSYQFVNLSSIGVHGFLDRKKLSLKAKAASVVKLNGSESRSINFGVWAMVDGKRKWLQRNTLTYKPSKYLIYFFYETRDRRGKMKMESKGIVAFRPPPVVDERGVASSIKPGSETSSAN
ncbi:hypothetical protein NT6N_35840 [Oceaniferula spumae]|uniref:Lipoprotein n=1 Tax=Oceaniferula spumae TaxID=2979115 RepID=A0AAT9FRB5_9BACT